MPEGQCSFETYNYKTHTYSPCTEPAELTPDPYDEEINGDDTPVWICVYHYNERRDDI